jgi:hypothetical protein
MKRVLLIGLLLLAGCAGKHVNEPQPQCDMREPACIEAVAKWKESSAEAQDRDKRLRNALIFSGIILGVVVLGAGWANQ